MIDKEAQKLYERIKELLQKGYSIKEIEEILLEEFGQFNEKVQEYIESEIKPTLKSIPPEILIGAKLSDVLYANAKEAAQRASYIIKEHIKSKKTIGELARKLYEGYGFRDKEVVEAKKKLPKYLQKELNNPNAQRKLLKQVNKLKTLPLRAGYTHLLEVIEKKNKKALDKALRVAIEEKARFYANRIAQTEIFRAKNWQNAVEYLEDDEVEFVKFEMSSSHPKTDICDFYANLDIGYGKGVVPKEQMRTLPLHPFCRCKYIPHYLTSKEKERFKKIRPKSFKQAQKETMAKFSKYEQKEILGSYQKLEEFKRGEDIERIFNRLRPKYPIRKYKEVLQGKKLYNEMMREAIKEELEEFLRIDKKIYQAIIELNEDNFKDLWLNEKEYKKHVIKRKEEGAVDSEEDYIRRIQEAFFEPDIIIWKKFTNEFKKQHKRHDRIYYNTGDVWVDVFFENGKISTAFVLSKNFSDIIFKGDAKTFEILNIPVKKVRK
ncbi:MULTISPECIES: hypothetical protein [unclassified Nitratiruptor]|uniref:hypothetical protein n=1 Tax=unclassified Nitratiruptor TaxID=2624044 RepID=UPI0019164473|nr:MULTISPECIES: hypothetical protein [unclassified Nitratiruptor]BCD59621.1 phage head morphogenesis protein [Nitratiruptor sp. YY08-10]BCD63545.1 phage head morphogenesis protein [Nitratiruptor sp. YY08-14]BCD83097.1 phage head morphogenesis protein [Nitratiruptor phage NrS-2]BCD83163.1 phage head morphogenesis protein [Nitratiruptor phage NrS-3]